MSGETVFFLPRHLTSWVRMLDLATSMARFTTLRPVMLLATPSMSARAEEARARGVEVIDCCDDIERQVAEKGGSLLRLERRLAEMLREHDRLANCLPVSLLRMAMMRRRIGIERRLFVEICRREQPIAVLVPGDRELSPVPSMLLAARDVGMPSILEFASVPYSAGLELPRVGFPRFHVSIGRFPPLLNFLVAWLYPKQVTRERSDPILYSPGWSTLAFRLEGVMPSNPWIQGCGLSSHVFHQDRVRLERMVERGMPREKGILVGDAALDPLHEAWTHRVALRQRLKERYGLTPARPLIVMSVPNDAEHDLCDWDTHLTRMDRYFACLGRIEADVLLSLHPKSERATYQRLADRYGLHFADQSLADILPAADLFVCSGSSTIFWAKLCAIPIVNLDYFDIMDSDFGGTGVVNVMTEEAFSQALKAFEAGGGEAIVGNLSSSAQKLREDHLFDGCATERICAYLGALATGDRQPAVKLGSDFRLQQAAGQ